MYLNRVDLRVVLVLSRQFRMGYVPPEPDLFQTEIQDPGFAQDPAALDTLALHQLNRALPILNIPSLILKYPQDAH